MIVLHRLPHLCLLLGTVLLTGAGPALAAPDAQCRRVDATGVGQAGAGGGPTVSTTAVITRDGLLKGTTAATFVIAPAPGPIVPFTGSIVFTTHRGTLTSGITGTLDAVTGAFQASGPVLTGTGRFLDASGSLTIAGTQDLGSGAFTETITGAVCLAKDGAGGA